MSDPGGEITITDIGDYLFQGHRAEKIWDLIEEVGIPIRILKWSRRGHPLYGRLSREEAKRLIAAHRAKQGARKASKLLG